MPMDPITMLLVAEALEGVFGKVDDYLSDSWRAQMAEHQNRELELLRHDLQMKQLEYQQETSTRASAERYRQELEIAQLQHELRLKEAIAVSNLRRKEAVDAQEWERILNH